MTKITPENITQDEILGLLEVLMFQKQLMEKIDPKQINFVKRQIFNRYVKKVNDLYEKLDKK